MRVTVQPIPTPPQSSCLTEAETSTRGQIQPSDTPQRLAIDKSSPGACGQQVNQKSVFGQKVIYSPCSVLYNRFVLICI